MVIRFFASIRSITGVKEIEWADPPPTLGDLLHLLSDRYGPEFRRWVLEEEGLGGSVMVVVNGNDARHQAGLATELAPMDVVSILPIMAGGVERYELLAISARRAPTIEPRATASRGGIEAHGSWLLPELTADC